MSRLGDPNARTTYERTWDDQGPFLKEFPEELSADLRVLHLYGCFGDTGKITIRVKRSWQSRS